MLSELLPEEKRRLHELEQQLIQLEHGNSVTKTNDITIGLEEMANRLDGLDKLVQKESKLRKEDYRRRVQHLRTILLRSYVAVNTDCTNDLRSAAALPYAPHPQLASSTKETDNTVLFV